MIETIHGSLLIYDTKFNLINSFTKGNITVTKEKKDKRYTLTKSSTSLLSGFYSSKKEEIKYEGNK